MGESLSPTIVLQTFMACGIYFSATLQLLGFFAFPSGYFNSIGDVVEALVIFDKQLAIEVSCPVAPFVTMQEYGECCTVGLEQCYRLTTGWRCLCWQRVQQYQGCDDCYENLKF